MHSHECRRCGSTILCDLEGCDIVGPTRLPVWEGDNIGCPNEQAEYALEEAPDLHNTLAQEGCDRCVCGCKYWEYDRCVDCGTHVTDLPHICNDVNPVPVDQCPACRVEAHWLKDN